MVDLLQVILLLADCANGALVNLILRSDKVTRYKPGNARNRCLYSVKSQEIQDSDTPKTKS